MIDISVRDTLRFLFCGIHDRSALNHASVMSRYESTSGLKFNFIRYWSDTTATYGLINQSHKLDIVLDGMFPSKSTSPVHCPKTSERLPSKEIFLQSNSHNNGNGNSSL